MHLYECPECEPERLYLCFYVLMEDGHFLQRAGGERHSADLFPRSLESSRDVSHYSFCPYNFDVLCCLSNSPGASLAPMPHGFTFFFFFISLGEKWSLTLQFFFYLNCSLDFFPLFIFMLYIALV